MTSTAHISHYFEREAGPLLSICDLDTDATNRLIEREREAETGFNRFSHGSDFFDFRKLADDLLIDLCTKKFGSKPSRRPYYAVLGDADVVGGLYRDPHKIRIPIDAFENHELTFMIPDHFHLVGLSKKEVKKSFGMPMPSDYTEEKYPYFGQLLTFDELEERYYDLKIDGYLGERNRSNCWYRYIEAQIWANPEDLRSRFSDWIEVDPEPWSDGKVTHLQNYKQIR